MKTAPWVNVVVCALLGVGCARSSPPPPPTAEAAPPVTLTVDGPALVTPGTDISLEVTVTLPGAVGVPLTWTVRLPNGVTARSDSAPLKDVFTATTTQVQRTLLLHVDAVPTENVEVGVDAATRAWGVHAAGQYRFGRPPLRAPQPPQDGPDVVLHGKNLGRPTLLDGK